jgi:predicted metal-dependent hydrolase
MSNWQKQSPDFVILNNLGHDIKVNIRISQRAKRIIIRINRGVPELVMPNRSYQLGYSFLFKKELWIRNKLQNLETIESDDNNIIPVFGIKHYINYIDLDHRKVKIKNDNIYVYATELKQRNILIEYLCNKLFVELKLLVVDLCNQHNLKFSDIKIMNNKTRWGSCSSNGILKFNWRLIFAPKDVIQYLVVHEIAHIVHMNHSKKFWDLVEKIYPEYKGPKTWLKNNGAKLHLYLNIL